MPSPLIINHADAALAESTPRVNAMLSMLGQGDARKPIIALLDSCGAPKFTSTRRSAAEDLVQVLNIVVHGADFQDRLSDDKLADLCSFFIQRIRHRENQ